MTAVEVLPRRPQQRLPQQRLASLLTAQLPGDFQTSSGISGLANESGEFQYHSGDNVTFSIGDVELGIARVPRS